MQLGVIATSLKPDERRVPIHPDHVARIPEPLRSQLVFEQGYGADFGMPVSGVAFASRAALLASCDAVLLLKPTPADLLAMREGAAHWGWPHAVQQRAIAEAAIVRKLTLVAFEAMHEGGVHTFHRNNELAGYAAVGHALALRGLDGHFGRPLTAVVLGYGSCARGALLGLAALGVRDVTVCLPAGQAAPTVPYVRVRREGDRMVAADGTPLLARLQGADLIINAILQDPLRPVMFVDAAELAGLKPGTLILDISCDAGMGFACARPTSFREPIVPAGPAWYYGVDHVPARLWDAASWEISEAVLRHLPAFLAGPTGWTGSEALRGALEIQDGRVLNAAITRFSASSSGPSAS